MSSNEKFEIIEIAPDGEPIEPIRTRKAFSAQCGVLVREKNPISIQQWYKPKEEDPEVSYVNDMQKEDLWTQLKENFTLPPEEDPEKPVKEELIKSCALKKMETLMRRWRKELNKFVDKKRHQNSSANMRRSKITGPHLWPIRHRKRVRRCRRQTRKMLRRRRFTIARGQVATCKPGLSGPRLRMICLKKGSNHRQ